MLRNKTAEKDIRDHLTAQGYYGASARFTELELHAVERPGWLQIMRFSVQAKTKQDEWKLLFGAMKDDERFKLCQIQCFENRNQQAAVLEKWSLGLTRPTYATGRENSFGTARTLLELLGFLVILAVGLGLLSLLS